MVTNFGAAVFQLCAIAGRALGEANDHIACLSQVGEDYYNGIPAIRAKVALTHSGACGVMMWELSQDTGDDTSLLKALREVVTDQPARYQCQ
ncbi:hypothetical protein QWI17_11950 [Gilvimarinus sp. SDUM040013]|uniref:Chitinase n=1 Tax=Gilvimarinus gilvus TaxID=3058038 RepID=A0ABU4RW93_9GAMM|nr:hypothetical protein [Gilvimarinus sp. SDUM040013]MDO3386549.1 hypothetical protein [Gilvimarinus sp. SDUM040013]MDX6849125.1 hypothetical protein [Gilvimarinus sp. SDUM040013]